MLQRWQNWCYTLKYDYWHLDKELKQHFNHCNHHWQSEETTLKLDLHRSLSLWGKAQTTNFICCGTLTTKTPNRTWHIFTHVTLVLTVVYFYWSWACGLINIQMIYIEMFIAPRTTNSDGLDWTSNILTDIIILIAFFFFLKRHQLLIWRAMSNTNITPNHIEQTAC